MIKKLNQLDQQRVSNLPKQGVYVYNLCQDNLTPNLSVPGGYSGLDYSSAEEEDFPPPIANSTRRQVGRQEVRNGAGGGAGGRKGQRQEETGAVTSRVTRSSRNNSRLVGLV